MARLSFKFDQLFILLVPELFVWFEVSISINCPSKPDVVQNVLSIKSKFVVLVKGSLLANPFP
jgi:hypothetical protein